jgi:hypothetical protein
MTSRAQLVHICILGEFGAGQEIQDEAQATAYPALHQLRGKRSDVSCTGIAMGVLTHVAVSDAH